jgi:hypothetical protein
VAVAVVVVVVVVVVAVVVPAAVACGRAAVVDGKSSQTHDMRSGHHVRYDAEAAEAGITISSCLSTNASISSSWGMDACLLLPPLPAVLSIALLPAIVDVAVPAASLERDLPACSRLLLHFELDGFPFEDALAAPLLLAEDFPTAPLSLPFPLCALPPPPPPPPPTPPPPLPFTPGSLRHSEGGIQSKNPMIDRSNNQLLLLLLLNEDATFPRAGAPAHTPRDPLSQSPRRRKSVGGYTCTDNRWCPRRADLTPGLLSSLLQALLTSKCLPANASRGLRQGFWDGRQGQGQEAEPRECAP